MDRDSVIFYHFECNDGIQRVIPETGVGIFGDVDHPELDYSEMYENSTFVSTSMIDVTSVNTDIGGIKFLGIEMPDLFSPARDLYTMLNAGLNVPIVIGNALGLEESFTKTIVAIMGILCLLGFVFFLRGTYEDTHPYLRLLAAVTVWHNGGGRV